MKPEDTSITPGGTSLQFGSDAPGIRLSPLFEALRNSARHLITEPAPSSPPIKQPSAAVIIAQTAIEVCTERIITRSLVRRGAEFLSDWVDGRVPNYNVFREDVKALYKAVTEDTTITEQDFWSSGRLKAHVELRNAIAHRGRIATPEEAAASITVAEQIIDHMSKAAARKSLDLGDPPT
jgi:hypothetical protein